LKEWEEENDNLKTKNVELTLKIEKAEEIMKIYRDNLAENEL